MSNMTSTNTLKIMLMDRDEQYNFYLYVLCENMKQTSLECRFKMILKYGAKSL